MFLRTSGEPIVGRLTHSNMMLMNSTRLIALSLMTAVPLDLQAQSPSGALADLQRLLKPGQGVVVTDRSGQKTTGRFVGVVDDTLVLRLPEAGRFPAETIAQVKRSDPIWNGAVIGGVILGTLCALVCGQGLDSRNSLMPVVAGNAGIGALIGLGMDALTKPDILYQRLPPTRTQAGNRGPSVSFSVRF